jgi:hypothetical protein
MWGWCRFGRALTTAKLGPWPENWEMGLEVGHISIDGDEQL